MTQETIDLIINNAVAQVYELADQMAYKPKSGKASKSSPFPGRSGDILDLMEYYRSFDGGEGLATALENERTKRIIADRIMYYETNNDEILDYQDNGLAELEALIMGAIEEVERNYNAEEEETEEVLQEAVEDELITEKELIEKVIQAQKAKKRHKSKYNRIAKKIVTYFKNLLSLFMG